MNWRNGKAGFVGGLKYIIKGVFQFAHSITSATPVGPTPDCYIAAQGVITELTMTDIAAVGSIGEAIAAVGTLDTADSASVGTLTDTIASQGGLCHE